MKVAWTLFVYLCVGTLISQAIMFAYLISAWKIDSQRWVQVMAAAQGIVPVAENEPEKKSEEEKIAEQPSYNQILEARALKYRNLELREKELRDGLSQIQSEQSKLAEEKKRYKQLRDGFDEQLLSMKEGSAASGLDEVRRTLESLKSKQAKALIMQMLDDKQIDEVVALLTPMAESKRAKILGEFKTPEDLDKLSEVLQRIREGLPAVSVPDNTRKQLEQLKTTQLYK
jgi:folylpolyglutamate synthase/dihydropteroate synthase